MNKVLIKYLIIKMCLGYGSSITNEELENLEKLLTDKKILYSLDFDDRFLIKRDNDITATYLLTPTEVDIMRIDEYEYNLLKKFAEGNKFKESLDLCDVNNDDLERARHIAIYLVEELMKIRLNNKVKNYKDMKDYDITKLSNDLVYLFKSFSLWTSYLLTHEDDVGICSQTKSNKANASYKAYSNHLIAMKKCLTIFNKYNRCGKINYCLNFANNTYYGMPSFKQDMLFLYTKDFNSEPIYIPSFSIASLELQAFKYREVMAAESKIKELIKEK